MLLKYKLNSVCDADHGPANGAQRTEYFLYTTIYCGCQCQASKYSVKRERSQKRNTHYLRIKCVLQAHHENNAYYVRIKSALWYNAAAGQTLSFPTKSSAGAVAPAELLSISAE